MGDHTLRDWQSDELEQIVKSVADKPSRYQRSQMKRLAELLDDNWELEYKHYLDAQVFDENNDKYLDATTASSFCQFIVQQAWLPPDDTYTAESRSLYSGRELFDNNRQIHSLLHTHVPYIGPNLKNEDFVNCLCVRKSVSFSDVTSYLLEWARQSTESTVPFHTSIEHMSRLYTYLKLESEDHDNQVQNLTDYFQEEKLIFVPDKFKEISPTENVPGHFHSIHSVCWSDQSTVLYTRQKYGLPLAPNLPKVLSLYYGMKEDHQNLYHGLKQAFVHFGVPETPRVVSYLTLVKYISMLSHRPQPEHVRDFTNIAFELVRLCNTDSTITPEYIYSNLKNAKIFPAKSSVWVSLQECLLDDDDKNIAKCFDKSDNVFFIHWPDDIAKRKFKGTVGKQQAISNQKDKEEFMKMCKIPKLSNSVTPKVDFAGTVSPVDKVKAQLSCWIKVIQQFIISYCNELYCQLRVDGIEAKLMTLQVLSVESLSCRYFIDHKNSTIASPTAIRKNCEYCYDGETSTVYISADKVEKPGVLLTALMKLFTLSASEDDSSLLKGFLEKLLLECPGSQEDLEDFINEHDIDNLPDDEPVWDIPLPKYHVEDNSESTTDEESDSASSEEENVERYRVKSDKSTEISEGESRLTCWPPRAAVDPSPFAASHTKRNPEIAKDAPFAMPSTSMQFPEMTKGMPPSVDRSTPADMRHKELPRSVHVTGHSIQEHDSGAIASSKSRQLQEENTSEDQSQSDTLKGSRFSSTPGESGKTRAGTTSTEQRPTDAHPATESEHVTSSPKEPHDISKKRSCTSEHLVECKRARVDFEVELVDIQHIVQSVHATSGNNPIVELLDITSSDDEEFRLSVGRWGEEYVYHVLKRIGRLPDGTRINSIEWINRDEESDKPYDIVVQLEPSNVVQEGRCVYIEVKSTASDKKDIVAISWNQLKFAENNGDNFHLYRVYSAGQVNSHLCMLENLYKYIKSHHVKFFFEL